MWRANCRLSRMNAKATNQYDRPKEAPVLLRASGLRKAFGGQVVLDGVDVELRRGEVVLLRGENGSGKTTLLNILTGNLAPDTGSIHYLADTSPRTYDFPRRWWQELNPFDHFVPEFVAREGIGRTWQDVRLFGSQTLRDNVSVTQFGQPGENPLMAIVAWNRCALREKELRDQANAVLSRVGLAGREESTADKISLGQSKRVAIARTVAAGAKTLFLDEPLAGLDRQGIADVLGLLKALVQDHTLALVIVEHVANQPPLDALVTTDWLLESGKLIYSPRSPKSQSTIPIQESPTPLRPPWFDLLAIDDTEIIDEPLPRGAILTRIRRRGRFDSAGAPSLEIRDLVVKRGQRVVICGECIEAGGLSLSLQPGELAILQAPNGWGKSTLIGAISGQFRSTGHIVLRGQEMNVKRSWDRARAGLVAVGSNIALFPSLTIGDARSLLPTSSILATALRDRLSCPLSTLSGGERQKVFINLSCSQHTSGSSIAIYDEPFAMLDHASMVEAMKQIVDTHTTTVFLVPHFVPPKKETA